MQPPNNSLEDQAYTGSTYDSSLQLERPATVIDAAGPGGAAYPAAASLPGNLNLFRFNKRAFGVIGVLLGGMVLVALAAFLWLQGSSDQASRQAAGNYAAGSLAVKDVAAAAQLRLSNADRLSVNGQLRVSDSVVLTPGGVPKAPTAGQIYYDQTAKAPYYYDGSQFVSLAPTAIPRAVTAIGGASGNFTLGTGLQLDGNQLAVSHALLQQIEAVAPGPVVSSLQSLTGDLALTAGPGISLNGLTITNGGVLNLTGTADQVLVSAGNGAVTVSLPQSIAVTSAPSFGGLTLATALPVSSGGTGATSFTANGIIFGNGSGALQVTAAAANGVLATNGSGLPSLTQTLPAVVQGNITVTGALAAGSITAGFGTIDIGNDISTSGELRGGGGLTVGVAGSVTGELRLANSTNSFLGTLQTGAIGQNSTYILPDPGPGGDTICLANLGNCGSGPNTISGTGTLNTIARFTGAHTIGNSSMTDNGTTVTISANLIANNVQTPVLQSAGPLSIIPGGALTVGATNHVLALQGNGSSTFSASASGFSSTLGFVTPTANRTINLPNESGTICLQGSANCGFASGGSGVTSLNGLAGALTLANASGVGNTITIDDASLTQKGIARFTATNFTAAAGVIDTIQPIHTAAAVTFGSLTLGAGGNLTLSPTGTVFTDTISTTGSGSLSISAGVGNITFSNNSGANTFIFPTSGGTGQVICTSGITCASGGGQAVILEPSGVQTANTNNTAVFINKALGTGNLIQLQTAGVDAFVINASGDTIIANTATADSLTVNGTLTANTLTPTGALTVGSTGQTFTIQGNGNSVIRQTDTATGFTTTLGYHIGSGLTAPAGNITYRLLNDNTVLPGTYNVCTTAGNCAGVGGGVTGTGTPGALAKFTSASAVGDSIMTDNGTTVTVGGNLAVGTASNATLTLGVASGLGGSLVFNNATNAFATTFSQATAPAANRTINIPNASGTLAVSASGPLSLDATTGQLSCSSCLTSGGGAGGGVSSITGTAGGSSAINGALTLNNALTTGTTITLDNASTTQKGIAQFNSTNFSDNGSGTINTVQNIHTAASPTFANLSLQGSTGLTVGSTTNLGQLAFRDGTVSGFASTFSSATLTANRAIIIPNASGTLAVSASGNLSLSAVGDLTIVNNPNFSTSVTTPLLQSSGTLAITPGGALTVGATGQTLMLQGNGSTTLSATNAGFTSTLSFAVPAANRAIVLPNESGTLCLQNSLSCGFAVSTGSGNYIQNSTGLQTNANFNIQSAAAGSVGGIIRGASGQTANLLQLQDSTGTSLLSITPTGGISATTNTNGFIATSSAASNNLFRLQASDGAGRFVLADTGLSDVQGFTGGASFATLRMVGNGGTAVIQSSGGASAAHLLLGAGYSSNANAAGAHLTLFGGQGTGTGVGGNILFRYAPAGSSGSTANPLQTACTISGTNGSFSCPGSGTNSERFGAGSSTGTFNNALAVGNGASVTGNSSVALGNGAAASGIGTAVGRNATVDGGSIAIGNASSSTGNHSIVIGDTASSSNSSSIVIGSQATANGATNSSIAIGFQSSAAFNGSIALGREATTTAANQLVIGGASSFANIQSVVIGNGVLNNAPVGTTINATGSNLDTVTGGALTLQGGAGTVGNSNGGNLLLNGGTKAGTGTVGNVILQGTNSGNVGIGTTSPGYKLEVANNAIPVAGTGQVANFRLSDGTNTGNINFFDSAGTGVSPGIQLSSQGIGAGYGGLIRGAITTADDIQSAGGAAIMLDAARVGGAPYTTGGALTAANLLQIRNDGAAKLTVDFAGNVGIGTTTPGNKLSVNALTTADNLAEVAINTTATTNKGIIIQGIAGQTADLLQFQDSTGAVIGAVATGDALIPIRFKTGTLQSFGIRINGSLQLLGSAIEGDGNKSFITSGGVASIEGWGAGAIHPKIRVGQPDGALRGNLYQASAVGAAPTTGSAHIFDIVQGGAGAPAGSINIASFRSLGVTKMNLNIDGQLQLPEQGATAGIVLGGDTNLYRSAADTLRTDDSFIVGTLGSGGTAVLCSNAGKISTCGVDAGSGSYVYNSTGLQSAANFNIQSSATNAIGGIIRAAAGVQTASLFELQNASGTVLSKFAADGALTVGANLIAQTGLYTGGGAGTLRLDASGTLQNVKFSNAVGALVTNSSGDISLTSGATSGLCLLSNGSSTAPSFQTCPNGSGGGSGYVNGGNNYTSNVASACGSTATTRIATSFDTAITTPTLGLCSNSTLDLLTNNISRINISNAGDIKVLSNSGNSTEKFVVRTQFAGNSALEFNTLRVDTASDNLGRVGIGLQYGTAPAVRLDIGGNFGSGNTSNGGIQVRASAAPGLSVNASLGVGMIGTGRIYFDEGTGKFKVSENGGAYVDLVQTGGSSPWLLGGNAPGSSTSLGTTNSTDLTIINRNVSRILFDGSNNTSFQNSGNVDFNNQSGGGTLLRIDRNNSSVLINTTSAVGGAALNVNGSINITNGNAYKVNGSTGASLTCSGGNQALGSFTFTGGILISGACATNNSDLAEAYNSSDNLQPGELVMLAGSSATDVNRATSDAAGNDSLMGIVSTAPAQTLGTAQVPNGYPIALTGRVPTKVNTEGGPIAIGDKITISSVAGIGTKATGRGMVVGTAMEAYSGTGTGSIEVFVNLSYYDPTDGHHLQAQSADFADLNVSGMTTLAGLTVTGTASFHGDIIVGGHIITAGGQPAAEPQAGAGTGSSGAGTGGGLGGSSAPTVTVSGTDTTGTITITTGDNPAAGELARLIFSQVYGAAPRVVLSPSNEAAAELRFYKGATTVTDFRLNVKDAPAAHTTYQFDYFIAQ